MEVKLLLQNFKADIQNAIDGNISSYHGQLPKIGATDTIRIHREITHRRMHIITQKFLNGLDNLECLKLEFEMYGPRNTASSTWRGRPSTIPRSPTRRCSSRCWSTTTRPTPSSAGSSRSSRRSTRIVLVGVCSHRPRQDQEEEEVTTF